VPVNGDEHRETAVAALADREYERAGDEYTRAAWRCLAEPREGHSPFEPDDRGWVGRGLESLAVAAVAYRVAGRRSRATRRAVEGVAVARDLRETADDDAQAACFAEFVADFETVGGFDGAGDAYEAAADAYRAAGAAREDPTEPTTTPLFQAAADLARHVARGSADGEIVIEWDDLHGPDPGDGGAFLAHRARFKRQRLPEFVDRAVAAGHLAVPRGTTEYGNANFRCPACESTDVNWVADGTFCLRCSTPMVGRD
jgi:hypothetical protein